MAYKNSAEITNFLATEKIKTVLSTQDQGLGAHDHNLLKMIFSWVAVTPQTQISVRNFGPKSEFFFSIGAKVP